MSYKLERDVPDAETLEQHRLTHLQWGGLEAEQASFRDFSTRLLEAGKLEGYRVLLLTANDESGIRITSDDKTSAADSAIERLRIKLGYAYDLCKELQKECDFDMENFALQASKMDAKRIKFRIFTAVAELSFRSIMISCQDKFPPKEIGGYVNAANKKLHEYLDEVFDDETFTQHKGEFFHYPFMSLVVQAFDWAEEPGTETAGQYIQIAYPKLPWMRDSLCLELDDPQRVMFPRDGVGVTAAQQICKRCLVKEECGEYAIDHEIREGIWGGYSERERVRILRARKKDNPPPEEPQEEVA